MPAFILPLYYFLAALVIFLGFTSLRGGVRFARYVRAELAHDYPEFTPFVTVFVPCRGLDHGLRENVGAILAQDYPQFEVIFVSDSANDPALRVVSEAGAKLNGQSGPVRRVVIAGAATDSGQKVHNLRRAAREADGGAEVFVLVDTDARPPTSWLRDLVAPLHDENVGAASGYRWFVPARGGFASQLRSVWNASIASALGDQSERNFCWGGSTAIRRETFERLGVAAAWRGTVSDDFTLTRVLHEAALPIKFVPQCLTPAVDECTLGGLLEFTTRQLKITRAYAAHLWRGVLIGSVLFALGFFGGLALVIARTAMGLTFVVPLALVVLIFVLGAMKSLVRLRAVSLIIPDPRMTSLGTTLAHLTLWPLASVLYLYNALVAAGSRRITWRGITYELKSPTETVIIRSKSDEL